MQNIHDTRAAVKRYPSHTYSFMVIIKTARYIPSDDTKIMTNSGYKATKIIHNNNFLYTVFTP